MLVERVINVLIFSRTLRGFRESFMLSTIKDSPLAIFLHLPSFCKFVWVFPLSSLCSQPFLRYEFLPISLFYIVDFGKVCLRWGFYTRCSVLGQSSLTDDYDSGGDFFLFYCFLRNKISSSPVMSKDASDFASSCTFEEKNTLVSIRSGCFFFRGRGSSYPRDLLVVEEGDLACSLWTSFNVPLLLPLFHQRYVGHFSNEILKVLYAAPSHMFPNI